MAPAFSTRPEAIDPAAICAHPNEWPENQSKLWTAFMPTLQGIDLRTRVPELMMPRLVIWPDRDPIPLAGVREWIVADRPVRLVTLTGADHSAFLDRPDALLREIGTFLSSGTPANR
jgi:pimeloyl-ACP methyl ester carboxylesterase